MNMDLLHWDPGYCKVIIKQFTDTTLGSTDYYLDVALWYDLDTLVKPPPFLLFLLSLAHSSTALTHSLTRAAIPNQTDTRDRREDPRPLRRTPHHIIQVDARYADQNRPLRCVTAAVQVRGQELEQLQSALLGREKGRCEQRMEANREGQRRRQVRR